MFRVLNSLKCFQVTAAFFECVGKVTAVRISITRDSADGMNRAWVEFESERAAREALEYSGKVQRPAPLAHACHLSQFQGHSVCDTGGFRMCTEGVDRRRA